MPEFRSDQWDTRQHTPMVAEVSTDVDSRRDHLGWVSAVVGDVAQVAGEGGLVGVGSGFLKIC